MLKHLAPLLLAGAICLPTGCNCGEDPASSADADEPGDDAAATQPGLDAAVDEPDAGGTHRDATVIVPGPDAARAALDAADPSEDAAQPGPDAGAPGFDAAAPGLDAAEPGLDAASPGLDAAAAGPDAAEPTGDTGPVGTVIIDLRADVNRNGTVDLADPTEDQGEDGWTSTSGAIFLANIDDDLGTCPKSGTDLALPKCNDAADEIVNGADDLLDLARLKTVPWPGAPGDASGTLTVSPAASVRLFLDAGGGNFVVFDPLTTHLTATQIRQGVELGLEGKDVVRNSALWDGYVEVTLTVSGSGFVAASDKVRLREAPIITRHHLHPPLRVYATPLSGDPDSYDFTSELQLALTASGVANPLFNINASDQWTQDYFETAYMAMPAVGGPHVMHVNVRSANVNRGTPSANYPLRSGGQTVFTQLRGHDVAGVQQYSTHDQSMDTLDSFGNLETIPPYSWNGVSYPLGRIYRGNIPSWHPDSTVLTLFESQQVQPALYVDTSFLRVGHVDETVTFLKAANSRGWTIAVADPGLAKTMLQQQQTNGNGSAVLFAGMEWDSGWYPTPADVTITELLNDTAVMDASSDAAAGIDAQLTLLKAETGITDAEILRIPVLFMKSGGYDVAYMVDTVNGISLGDAHYGSPDPHGPIVNGADLFKTQLTQQLSTLSIGVHWIENWNLYHRYDGEVHCGSNTTRQVPATERWWESGR